MRCAPGRRCVPGRRRNETVITPVQFDVRPVDITAVGGERGQNCDAVAATCQHYVRHAAFTLCGGHHLHEPGRRGGDEFSLVVEDEGLSHRLQVRILRCDHSEILPTVALSTVSTSAAPASASA